MSQEDKQSRSLLLERKRVRFNAGLQISDNCSKPLSFSDRQNLWYGPSDLAANLKNARDIVLGRKIIESEDELIGLDRFAGKRVSQKFFAIECVLLAERRRYGEEYIQEVASDCSRESRWEAAIEGQRMFLRAYPEKRKVKLPISSTGTRSPPQSDAKLQLSQILDDAINYIEKPVFQSERFPITATGKHNMDNVITSADRCVRQRLC